MTRVLFVDDDIELLDIAKLLLQQSDLDIEVIVATSVKEALERLEKEQFDIVIADYLMPDASGIDLLEAIRSSDDAIGFIMWTGHSREEVAIKALNLGADYYILKGANYRDQFNTIRDVMKKIISKKNTNSKTIQNIISQKKASEFIHRLSHDITGIIHNIIGYATLIEEEQDMSYIQGISRLVTKLSDRMKSAVETVDTGVLTL
ncbi:MAG: response regulator [Candidatus Thorarchaeota archaeon]|nr:response regulator [Candidatus Thorarchaeota archaeon]